MVALLQLLLLVMIHWCAQLPVMIPLVLLLQQNCGCRCSPGNLVLLLPLLLLYLILCRSRASMRASLSLLLQILSVRTHGETGSHLPDEVMQPGLARQLRSSSSGCISSISSISKSSTSKSSASKAGGSSTFDPAGSSTSETAAGAACPSAYEYYVHYRLTNRRLDCWLRFSDLLPVNARGQVLLPTGFDQHGTSRQAGAATGAAATGAADTAALEAVRDEATADADRTDEHMPKRMKVFHESVVASDAAAASATSASASPPQEPVDASPAGVTPPAAEHKGEDDCAAAAAAWKRLEQERHAEAEELKALLFDPSLVFSDVRAFKLLYQHSEKWQRCFCLRSFASISLSHFVRVFFWLSRASPLHAIHLLAGYADFVPSRIHIVYAHSQIWSFSAVIKKLSC